MTGNIIHINYEFYSVIFSSNFKEFVNFLLYPKIDLSFIIYPKKEGFSVWQQKIHALAVNSRTVF